MTKIEIYELVSKLLSSDAINVDGNIEDRDNYTEIYRDGQFSDVCLTILYSPVRHSFIKHIVNKYQGAFCGYTQFSFKDYIAMMPEDEIHFNRWLDGLKIIADIF